jgi:hypothetical protein
LGAGSSTSCSSSRSSLSSSASFRDGAPSDRRS